MDKIEEAKALCESIICLCAEGREVMGLRLLLDAIQRDAERGYKILDSEEQEA